eukprot:CAMPEP_0182843862 /NCGR_PEP_ID=MMETSP0006_2-20121128/26429_1 /TAXON_ID=97485 /ORGANISM="Prymnesium parvum, Strain Texoma1" /LENGTH=155 /DNA_ID=CAMNT_0024973713 /DNA_START=458 /DNA_END=921 /DNA_ORIENTATION=-
MTAIPSCPHPRVTLSHRLAKASLALLFQRVELRVREGDEPVSVAHVELVLELDPLQAQRVQKGGEVLHHHEHAQVEREPDGEHGEEHNAVEREGVLCRREGLLAHDFVPEELRELRVREGERPQPQVRGGIRDGAEDELDRVDHLMDDHLAEVLL